jgi:predicted NBD/HSP70 family sugar kinase
MSTQRAIGVDVGGTKILAGLGLGVPGRVDHESGVAYRAVNTPLARIDLMMRMGPLGLPVGLENDGNSAAFAERRLGAARGARTAIALTLATGVGGGLILVIGGGFAVAAFDLFLPGVREVLQRDAPPPAGEVPVVAAALGAEAGPVGAAPIAFETLDAGG